MRKTIALLMLAIFLTAGMASAHRMFVGQRVTLDLYAIFDDGTPAKNATVQVYRDDVLFSENSTDSKGRFTLVLPGKGSGKWRCEVSSSGHTEEVNINIENDMQANKAALAAGLVLIGIPTVYASRRKRNRG
jgi:nickel transport protein